MRPRTIVRAIMTSMIRSNFRSIGWELWAVNRFEVFEMRATTTSLGKSEKADNKRLCGLSSTIYCQVSGQSEDNCRLWIDLNIWKGAPHSAPWKEIEKSAPVDLCGLMLLSPNRVSAQSDIHCSRGIDLNISRDEPPQSTWEEIEEFTSERLCGLWLVSSYWISAQSHNNCGLWI